MRASREPATPTQRPKPPLEATLDRPQLVAAFHLSAADRALVARQATPVNRFGLALQLGCVRHRGAFVANFADVSVAAQAYVAQQIGLAAAPSLDRYRRSAASARHRAIIRRHDGYRELREPGVALPLARWLLEHVWATDERPEVLVERLSARMRRGKVLLPGPSVLLRAVQRARARMDARLYRRLIAVASSEELAGLERLLDAPSPGSASRLDHLRRRPRRVTAEGLVVALERLAEVRDLGGGGWDLRALPAAKVARLAGEAGSLGAQALRRMAPLRRRASLVAFVHGLRRSAQDDALTVFDLYLRGLLGRVARQERRERLRTMRTLDAAARDLALACAALLDDAVEDADVRLAAFRRISSDRLASAVDVVTAALGIHGAGGQRHLVGRYAQLRRFLPRMLDQLQLEGNTSGLGVLAAWDFLRTVEGRRRPDMGAAPVEVVRGPWREAVWNDDGTLDRGLYSWCVLDRLRDALSRRDVYARESVDFADPRTALLDGPEWTAARPGLRHALDLPDSGAEVLASLRSALAEAYRVADAALDGSGATTLVAKGGRVRPTVARLDRLPVSPELIALRARIAGALPAVDLSELLLEVDAWTGFVGAMADARRGRARAEGLHRSVCAVLLAQACNIGLPAVASPSDDALALDRLEWVQQRYLRGGAIVEANARLVDAQSALPLAARWGGGHVASADGLRFVVPMHSADTAPNSRYFGLRKGLTYYNFVSDQHTGFHAVVVPGTLRDSLFVLDGLLLHRTRLEPDELMADTAGYSDAVFGLFWLLGFQFSPRLRDVSDLRFWRMDAAADHGRFGAVARHTVRVERIERHWEDLLRIAGSLRMRRVRPSDFMRTLQSGGRSSHVRMAIVELGRVIKTLYLLAFLGDPDYRRRILTQLNRGESRHALARSVFFGRRGELRQPYRQGQEDQLGALGLVVNAIALWNTTYIADILDTVSRSDAPPDPAAIARLSPLVHEHIRLVGHYRFELPSTVADGCRRPIAMPPARSIV